MVMAVAFDDARAKQVRKLGDGKGTKGGYLNTPFLGASDQMVSPQAWLAQFDPGRSSSTHFHTVDQFQVIVGGKGKIGRHDLAAYRVHFSHAYTPYGPLLSDAIAGLRFFVLRARADPGAQRLSEHRGKLLQIANRQPWQIACQATFPALDSGTAAEDVMLQAIPGIKDGKGLAAYTLTMRPNAKADAPDPSHGDGQYLVVVKGSLWHDDKEHKALALVFVRPDEGAFRLRAGAEGLEALVLNFPQLQTGVGGQTKTAQTATHSKIWQCALCAFVYDEAAGLPHEGIAPGTRWEDVPESWSCPDCSACKADFQMVELQN